MLWTHLMIHVHELALKGRNRNFFERRLGDNIRCAFGGLPFGRPQLEHGRVVVPVLSRMKPDWNEVSRRVRHLFGASNASPAVRVSKDIDAISKIAIKTAIETSARTFRIRTRRADKTFPMTSMEIDRAVGEAVCKETNLKVSLKTPDATIVVDILPRAAYISSTRFAAPGGLPVGTSGRFGVLLSGGIDSPVAAYEIMKRGGECVFVHFHSVPYTDRASIEKVKELSGILAGYQGRAKLWLVPLADLQKMIIMKTPQELRVILYRRLMIRVAERLLGEWGAQALVTGESLGQVASQTIENIRAVEEAATLPVLRPLITRNKEDIVTQAKKIGTFEISIRPHDDCCSLFMPSRPTTHATVAEVKAAEAALSVDELVIKTAAAAETVVL